MAVMWDKRATRLGGARYQVSPASSACRSRSYWPSRSCELRDFGREGSIASLAFEIGFWVGFVGFDALRHEVDSMSSRSCMPRQAV